MTITEQLRQAIADSGETHYRIGKESGVAPHVLLRFVSQERPHLRTDTVDRLCEYLGLELTRKKGATSDKQAGKKRVTSRKSSERVTKTAKGTRRQSAKGTPAPAPR